MEIKNLNYYEAIDSLEKINNMIKETDIVESIDIGNSIIINIDILGFQTIDKLNLGGIVDESSLDEAIWNFIDDVGMSIKSMAEDYAYENNIKIV